jgi:hypothetical protein
MANGNGCDPSWSKLRCEMELRKQDYLSKSSLDQCLLRARPSEDPAVRAKFDKGVLTPCDPPVLQLNFPWETTSRILGRLATGVFPWMLDPNIPTSEYPAHANQYWQNSLADTFNHLEKLQDTADFHANDVLRIFYLFGGGVPEDAPWSAPSGVPTGLPSTMPASVTKRLRDALHHFKYWIDEPPTRDPNHEEMTFWSENHQIEFATAQYLAGQLWPDDYFPHSGIYGRDHMRRASPRLIKWLDRRLAFGFSEWNSPSYYNEDFPPLFNLADFCNDVEISRKAAMVLDTLIFDLGRFTVRGSFGVAAGRDYFEHKNCALSQAAGNLVEILFGTRGVWVAPDEPSAMALATSPRYVPPNALLAIGQDARKHFIDRTRVSISFDEASQHSIGFSSEDDIVFWWGCGAFYTSRTLDGTRNIARSRGLTHSGPFVLLIGPDGTLSNVGLDLLTMGLDLALSGTSATLLTAAVVVPPPFNLALFGAGLATGAASIVAVPAAIQAAVNVAKDVVNVAVSGVETVVDAVGGLFGGSAKPDTHPINRAAILDAYEQLLIQIGTGSALTRANLYTYSNGDVILSSVQNHMSGTIAAQKQVWQATLGMKASVWTTRPTSPVSASSIGAALEQSFIDQLSFKPLKSELDLLLPAASGFLAKQFGHDGPNQWTGSMTLPMVVQHENALIAAYDPTDLQRSLSGPWTHAWFPKPYFEEVIDDGGNWKFGRVGDGYVGLYSAQPSLWATGDFQDKEILARGFRNVWVCQVGNAAEYGPFQQFVARLQAAPLTVIGLDSPFDRLACFYDMPTSQRSMDQSHRLGLQYGIGGSLDGQPLALDTFPRFENPYAQVAWGQRSYTIAFQRLKLHHNLDAPSRQGDGI